MNFKVGDWVYHNFELCQIMNYSDDLGVHELSTGAFGTGGRNLFCVPLNKRNKLISEEFEFQYRKLKDLQGLNFPDIFSYLIETWEICVSETSDDNVKKHYQKISEFVNNIIELSNQRLKTTVSGVEIFR
jgi:hypothetical protein